MDGKWREPRKRARGRGRWECLHGRHVDIHSGHGCPSAQLEVDRRTGCGWVDRRTEWRQRGLRLRHDDHGGDRRDRSCTTCCLRGVCRAPSGTLALGSTTRVYAYLLWASSMRTAAYHQGRAWWTGPISGRGAASSACPVPKTPAAVERLIPGARFVTRIDMGEACAQATTDGDRDRRASSLLRLCSPLSLVYALLTHSPHAAALPPVPGSSASSDDLRHSPTLTTPWSATEPLLLRSDYPRPQSSSNVSTASSPSDSATPKQQPNGTASNDNLLRVIATINSLKADPKWRAVRYSLLRRNCNDFTSELCRRLTGQPASRVDQPRSVGPDRASRASFRKGG